MSDNRHRKLVLLHPALNPVKILLAQARIVLNLVGNVELTVFSHAHLVIGKKVNSLEVWIIPIWQKELYDLIDLLLAVIDSL